MLEYWYKDRRTLVDFRRGPLGSHFDGFAAHLKKKGYSSGGAVDLLSKCCLFNVFLIDRGITQCRLVSQSLVDAFVVEYLANLRTTSLCYKPEDITRRAMRVLFAYLVEVGAIEQPKPKPERTPYSWMLEPYVRYLRDDREVSEHAIRHSRKQLSAFLQGLGDKVARSHMKSLGAKTIETYVKQHMKESPENLRRLASALRGFLRFCARKGYTNTDLSGLIPSVPYYKQASLPRGMEESALQRVLDSIPKDTQKGSRDYAILLLLMAYGIRGKSVAALLLEDIHWDRSTIRIRAQKGGKEVTLPLLEAVGEAILAYLRCRPECPLREVFLAIKAPLRPLNSVAISGIVRCYMGRAGVRLPRGGTNTFRHSWAIRALAHDASMKAIADVLGHRCLDTTFIYAKADLKALRQVAMPWPEGR